MSILSRFLVIPSPGQHPSGRGCSWARADSAAVTLITSLFLCCPSPQKKSWRASGAHPAQSTNGPILLSFIQLRVVSRVPTPTGDCDSKLRPPWSRFFSCRTGFRAGPAPAQAFVPVTNICTQNASLRRKQSTHDSSRAPGSQTDTSLLSHVLNPSNRTDEFT